MRWAYSLPRWLAAATAGLFSVSLVAALVTSSRQPAPTRSRNRPRKSPSRAKSCRCSRTPKRPRTPPHSSSCPTKRGVRGWVAGEKSFAGSKVTIRAGNKDFETTVGDDNTFVWARTSAKPLPLTFTHRPAAKPLTAHTTLPARPEGSKRTAFVVTDRSAYRPGHTLKFVAYVHDTTDGIDFKPVANQEFTVDLVSETRAHAGHAAEAPHRRRGPAHRAVHVHRRRPARPLPLEHRCAGRATTASRSTRLRPRAARRVPQDEGRPEAQGRSEGRQAGRHVRRPRLPRPQREGHVRDVVRGRHEGRGRRQKLALDPTKFVADEGGPPSVDDFDALPDDERLLTLANGVSAMSFAGFGGRHRRHARGEGRRSPATSRRRSPSTCGRSG